MKRSIKIPIAIVLYLFVAIVIMELVYQSGVYPAGSDTMYHVYRGDYVYKAWQNGEYWPLLNHMWYNGVELMRYWPPVAAYTMALCDFFAGGNIFHGYILYLGLVYMISALSWLFIGVSHKRENLGIFLGAIWFLIPNNLYCFFLEGNLPRSLIVSFLPLLIMCLYDYLEEGRVSSMAGYILLFAWISLMHLGYAGMVALSFLLFLPCYRLLTHRKGRGLDIIWGTLVGFAITGLYLIPSVVGGMVSGDSGSGTGEVMALFFQSLWRTLNPVERIQSYGGSYVYFGLSVFLIALLMLIGAKRDAMAGSLAGILILLLTTSNAYTILKSLPGGQFLWMLRFVSIAICFVLYGMLLWKNLRKGFVILFCLLLAVDSVPSLYLLWEGHNGVQPETRYDQIEESTLRAEAKAITKQRMSVMDGQVYGATGAYLEVDYGDAKPSVFGAGREAAVTTTDIVQANQAMENGEYLYFFDRQILLGADTILIKKVTSDWQQLDMDGLSSAATATGYELVDENAEYLLYHLQEATGNFGVVSDYVGLAIGTGASDVCRMFPSVIEAVGQYVDDFTYEELADYEIVYLNGFQYHDREAAEELVRELSENGTKVVIFADGIPIDEDTQRKSFLGVDCQSITFHNGYPDLETTELGKISTDLFPKDYKTWNTVFINGLENVLGYVSEESRELAFYGTQENENQIFIAFNLTFFYSVTHDPYVAQLLSEIVDASTSDVPEHTLVPMEVTYSPDTITFETLGDASYSQLEINTTLSYHDIFRSVQNIHLQGHMLYINSGKTVVQLHYPYFLQGLAVTLLGIILMIIFLKTIHNSNKRLQEFDPSRIENWRKERIETK